MSGEDDAKAIVEAWIDDAVRDLGGADAREQDIQQLVWLRHLEEIKNDPAIRRMLIGSCVDKLAPKYLAEGLSAGAVVEAIKQELLREVRGAQGSRWQ